MDNEVAKVYFLCFESIESSFIQNTDYSKSKRNP